MLPPLLTVAEIAEQLRVAKMTVYRLIHDGTLPAIQVGRGYRVKVADFERYLENCEVHES